MKGIADTSSYDYDVEEVDGRCSTSVTTDVCESIRVTVYLFKKDIISSYIPECKVVKDSHYSEL
jgi:hypothetical protein